VCSSLVPGDASSYCHVYLCLSWKYSIRIVVIATTGIMHIINAITVSAIHVLARDKPCLYESDSLVLGSSSGSCAEPVPGRGAELQLRRDSATIGVRRLVVHEAAHVRLDGHDVQPSRDRGLRPPSSTSRRRTRVMQTRSAFSAYAIRTASA